MKRINFDRKEQRKLRHKRITNTLKRVENKKLTITFMHKLLMMLQQKF